MWELSTNQDAILHVRVLCSGSSGVKPVFLLEEPSFCYSEISVSLSTEPQN